MKTHAPWLFRFFFSFYGHFLLESLKIYFKVTERFFFSLVGKRFIKLAKSPISPSLAFPFNITSSGISLLTDDGIEISGPEINTIHCQGLSLRTLLILETPVSNYINSKEKLDKQFYHFYNFCSRNTALEESFHH